MITPRANSKNRRGIDIRHVEHDEVFSSMISAPVREPMGTSVITFGLFSEILVMSFSISAKHALSSRDDGDFEVG